MVKNFAIKPPFFEVGPKAIIWGDAMLKLAKVIDKTAMKYDLDVIVTPQYTDIKLLADKTGAHLDYEWPVGLMMIHNDQINYMLPIGLYI